MSIDTDRFSTEPLISGDKRGRFVADLLLVEIKVNRTPDQAIQDQLVRYLQQLTIMAPFAMSVNRHFIKIYTWDAHTLVPVDTIAAEGILSEYDPDYANKAIYHDYLTTLVSAWLRDVAYHWRSENPPAYDQLQRLGLAQLLVNGTTEFEAVLR
jgi:hypothetical protein